MKKLFATLALVVLTSCAASGPVMLSTEGALLRQVTRVVERHDAYVSAVPDLPAELRSDFLAESGAVTDLMAAAPEVEAELLLVTISPVMERHDVYVFGDDSLDDLTKDTYLASTRGLKALLVETRRE